MGLLDTLTSSSMDDPKSQAVLGLAMGLLSGRGSDGFAKGIQGAMQGYQNAKQSKWQDEQIQWKRDDIAREKQQREQAANIDRLIQQQFLPVTGSQAISGDALGPTVGKAQNIGQTQPIDYQALAAQRVPFERLKQLADAANLGRAKVARTVKGVGPDGREYEYQVDEFGGKVGDGMAQFRAPVMQDLGGQVAALDPYSLKPMAQFGKTMTPDGQASNAVAWANNANARQRLAFDMAGGADAVNGGKPQFNADAGGYIYPPSKTNPQGAIVPLQGFQRPLNDVQSKAQLFGTRMQEADKILTELAAGGKNFSTVGSNTPFIGGIVNSMNTEQGQMLDQAKRDFTNAVLRRESGAAIAGSEFESANKQYFPQLGDSPGVIAQKARARQLAVNGILAEVPAGTKPITVTEKPKAPGKAPMIGQLVDGYKFKGGNPADPSSWEKQ